MSEGGDYERSPSWDHGHNFSSARDYYRDTHVAASRVEAQEARKPRSELLPAKLKTNSPTPVVLVGDETGSVGKRFSVAFSKSPYLVHEAKEYLGPDTETCVAAIGDAHNGENYPLQAREFTGDRTVLKTRIAELMIESLGGGSGHETYELAALYFANNVEMPKATKPIIIFFGDELPYDEISPSMAEEIAHVKIKKTMTTEEVFEALKRKFSVYFIQFPYNTTVLLETKGPTENQVYTRWVGLLGADHVSYLPDPERIVDVIFGILG